MKKLIALLSVTLSLFVAHGQEKNLLANSPLSISYFGHYGFHPGVKVGTQFNLITKEKSKEKKKGTRIKSKSLFVSPQIGGYVHVRNHSALLINTEIGYQTLRPKNGFYSSWSLGLGYLTQFNSGITYEYLEDGSIKERKFASRAYFLPTINYEFGQQLNDRIGWFSKLSLGSKIKYNTGISLDTFFELGVKVNLTRTVEK